MQPQPLCGTYQQKRRTLARADSFNDAEAKQKMRRIAETYEQLAQRLDRHARDADNM
jgi:hypothetical protein